MGIKGEKGGGRMQLAVGRKQTTDQS